MSMDNARPVAIRDCWNDEANDLTPWLAESVNLAELSKVLGVQLTFEARERRIGRYRADLICTFAQDGKRRHAVIENQLERSDHRHLGQLVTYAGDLDDLGLLVWIAPEFSDEHLQAVDRMNRDVSRWSIKAVEISCKRAGPGPTGEFRAARGVQDRPPRRSRGVSDAGEWRFADHEVGRSGPVGEFRAASRGRVPPSRRHGTTGAGEQRRPDRIVFLTSFLEWLRGRRVLPAGARARISGPGESPPFVEIHLGKATILLKAKVHEPRRLGVELLVRRWRNKNASTFDAYVGRITAQVPIARERSSGLRRVKVSDDREPRFFVTREFENDVTDQHGLAEKYDWLRDTMQDHLTEFAPVIDALDLELGR